MSNINEQTVSNIGFTGTREGMTTVQKCSLIFLLKKYYKDGATFHYGNCLGADEEAAEIAKEIGYKIESHPCTIAGMQSNKVKADTEHKPIEALARNRKIVDSSDIILATPKETIEVMRSGTWQTIRYAARQGKEGGVIWKDGNYSSLSVAVGK